MKAEITITGRDFADVKAAAIDFQMVMESAGWRFSGVRASPKDKRAVVVLRREPVE